MSDHLLLEDFRLECVIGDYPEERKAPQTVRFSIDIEGDFSNAVRSDDIADALDYTAVEKLVLDYVPATSFRLVESLAAGIADMILAHFALARTVSVTLVKERKVLTHANVTLKLSRTRGNIIKNKDS